MQTDRENALFPVETFVFETSDDFISKRCPTRIFHLFHQISSISPLWCTSCVHLGLVFVFFMKFDPRNMCVTQLKCTRTKSTTSVKKVIAFLYTNVGKKVRAAEIALTDFSFINEGVTDLF